jgi:aryl-alcohol dehydrogenase-like predicted oxidoreductase
MQGGNDGLPFGLAGEAMRVGLLRQAAQTTDDPYDHEHVTPWVIRRCGRNAPVILPPWGIDLTGVRCTIDTLDDYRTVAAALAGLDDPVSVPWQTMCERLARWMTRARPSVPARIVAGELHASLVLGGAPIGLAHSVRKPDDKELHAILDLAEAAGVTHVDTAAGYGDSEHRIGSALTADSPLGIVTKLPPHLMDGEPTTREVAQRVHVAIDRSVWLLGRSRLEAVLLHRFEHFDAAEGVIWRTLLALQAEGKVGRIGASVDRPDELSALLASPEVGLVQVPFNILDRRWLEPDIQRAIAARPDVVIHGCSALLQGLLTINDPSEWPIPDGDLAHRCTAGLQAAARSLGRESVADLCFAYVRAQPWLAGIIVGAETAAQMSENIRLFRTPALTLAQAEGVAASLPGRVPEQLLNPALWPRR